MKFLEKFLSLLFLFLATICLHAQIKEVKFDKTYIFQAAIKLEECDAYGDTDNLPIIYSEKGWWTIVDKDLGDDLVIYFPKWNNKQQELNQYAVYRDSVGSFDTTIKLKNEDGSERIETITETDYKESRIYYLISKEKFMANVKLRPSWFDAQFGTATIPIKIRPGNREKNIPFDFNGNFNAGVGLNFKLRKIPFKFYGGISITSVPTDSLTTKGFIKTPTNSAALTPTIGLIQDVSGVQIGAFIGFDYLARDLGRNWLYQGRRWFGIGISANIFELSSGAGATSSTKQGN